MASQTISRIWKIYKITCLVNGKGYIGLTVDSVEQRWSNHVCQATRYGTMAVFHQAIRKYGRPNFSIETIQTAYSLEEASELEISSIITHNTRQPSGYNIAEGGAGTPGVPVRHSEATRKKISIALTGRIVSEATKQKQSAQRKGRVLGPEWCQHLSDARRKRPMSLESIAKQAASVRGRNFPKRSIALLKSPRKDVINSTSGVRGVIPEGKRWTARIGINGKRVHIGVFDTKEEAAAAYATAVEKRISELAKTQ